MGPGAAHLLLHGYGDQVGPVRLWLPLKSKVTLRSRVFVACHRPGAVWVVRPSPRAEISAKADGDRSQPDGSRRLSLLRSLTEVSSEKRGQGGGGRGGEEGQKREYSWQSDPPAKR